jgi:hypothetical protein
MVAQSYGATATTVARSAGLPATQGWWPVFVGGHPGGAYRRPAGPPARRGACGGVAEGWVRGTTRGGRRRRPMVAPREQPFPRRSWRRSMTSQPEALGKSTGSTSRIGVGSVCACHNARTSSGRGRVAVGSEHASAEDVPSTTRSSANGAPLGARDVERIPLETASGLMWCPEGGRSDVRAAG